MTAGCWSRRDSISWTRAGKPLNREKLPDAAALEHRLRYEGRLGLVVARLDECLELQLLHPAPHIGSPFEIISS